MLTGPEPSDNGDPLEPLDRYGHDHLAWLDRMVRSNQHLVERMALIFHDWFGLRRDDVGQMDLGDGTSTCSAPRDWALSATC